MKHLRAYDSYLKRMAQSGAQKPGIAAVGLGPILLATAPFYVAIVMVTAIFPVLGWAGPVGTTVKLLISLVLLFALFYSGFRVVHYRAQSRKGK